MDISWAIHGLSHKVSVHNTAETYLFIKYTLVVQLYQESKIRKNDFLRTGVGRDPWSAILDRPHLKMWPEEVY